ncbi:MAG: M20/M25/M40 family metallo-hydrolase [Zoogloeaceae bacterium]|jgi:dipeptidase D|nr:M20/M25/M40 family metallo-hydrolase [Zoogloeaceae bacterium]
MSIPSVFSTLAPQPVWQHFATLCAIPRPSKHEAALVAHLRDWATRRGIAARVDSAGNLILQKPATPGQEGAPGVVLQGHLDMVCQQETGHGHDFLRDPITPELEDGWLIARHTTLGADNGIGVALALAALEDATLIHGPLEVLLTVDEEAGMSGAHRLAPGSLRGRYLLNLDTEAWGKFYLGCAGGVTVAATWPVTSEAAPAHWQGARLTLDGLPGGHSGIDIHRPHAHAIRDLQQVLRDAASEVDFALARLEGGTAINALPRFAEAHLALPLENFAALKQWVAQADARLKNTWGDVAPQLGLRLEAAPLPERVIADASWRDSISAMLYPMPYGVAAMSADFPAWWKPPTTSRP